MSAQTIRSRPDRLFSPTWVLRFTNAELLEEFGNTYEQRKRGDEPGLMRRLDVLYDEIQRRYATGTMTDDDWDYVPAQ
jgi:hypothetical protein